jgi:hypothetical protein
LTVFTGFQAAHPSSALPLLFCYLCRFDVSTM